MTVSKTAVISFNKIDQVFCALGVLSTFESFIRLIYAELNIWGFNALNYF